MSKQKSAGSNLTKLTLSSTREAFLSFAESLFSKCVGVMRAKNEDYSRGDCFFKNFLLSEYLGVANTENGMMVRITDKVARICNLLEHDPEVLDESILDTIEDSINYFALLYLYLKATRD